MQSLRFAPKSPLLLLEVPDEHFLTELGFDPKTDLLTTHTPPRVVLRGNVDRDAFVCTPTRTYALKEAEVSNQILLTSLQVPEGWTPPPLDAVPAAAAAAVERYVHNSVKSYYELTQVIPKWERLHELLEQAPYTGGEHDASAASDMDDGRVKRGLYSTDDLLNEISASEAELLEALANAQAVQVDGYWRILDFKYMVDLMDMLKKICEGHSWTFRAIPDNGIIRSMQHINNYSPIVVRHCLRLWADTEQPKVDDQGEPWWRLSESKVCRFLGLYLLKSIRSVNERSLPMSEFMPAWSALCPEEMRPPKEEHLSGLVVRTITPIGVEYLKYFPQSSLPTDPRERFNRLFAEQPRWTLEEITPFISDLAPDPKQRDALLLKHTRSSVSQVKGKQEGVKHFYPRYT